MECWNTHKLAGWGILRSKCNFSRWDGLQLPCYCITYYYKFWGRGGGGAGLDFLIRLSKAFISCRWSIPRPSCWRCGTKRSCNPTAEMFPEKCRYFSFFPKGKNRFSPSRWNQTYLLVYLNIEEHNTSSLSTSQSSQRGNPFRMFWFWGYWSIPHPPCKPNHCSLENSPILCVWSRPQQQWFKNLFQSPCSIHSEIQPPKKNRK